MSFSKHEVLRNESIALTRREIFKKNLEARIARVKQEAILTNKRIIHERTLASKNVLENLRIKSEQIVLRHEEIARRVNSDAIRKDAQVRVNRGLESLKEMITILRLSNWSDLAIAEAIQDPSISGTPEEKIQRLTVSEFIKSIQKQLVEQTEFINIAAHELRTPILPILVNAEILDLEFGEREEVRVILRNAIRLQKLAQNILDVAKLSTGTLKLAKGSFDLTELIREVVQDENVRLTVSNVKICFVETEHIEVVADRDRISQVLFNLLDNAIKFTTNGTISVAAEKHEREVAISVVDSGPGIESSLFPLLFSKFGKNSNSGTGLGLGLFISKCIVDAHGGKIRANNNIEQGRGASFSFTLPLY